MLWEYSLYTHQMSLNHHVWVEYTSNKSVIGLSFVINGSGYLLQQLICFNDSGISKRVPLLVSISMKILVFPYYNSIFFVQILDFCCCLKLAITCFDRKRCVIYYCYCGSNSSNSNEGNAQVL